MQKVNCGAAQWGDGIQADLIEGVNFSGRFAANSIGGVDIFGKRRFPRCGYSFSKS